MKKTDKVKSPIDSMIIDLIMEHYNIQSLQGKRESLSGDEFMNLVVLAESQYYENVLEENVTDTNVGMA
tara:strand:+ start:2787 stop:2993 length:207 start_codon:yes stop_codon:yes gene_type:complete